MLEDSVQGRTPSKPVVGALISSPTCPPTPQRVSPATLVPIHEAVRATTQRWLLSGAFEPSQQRLAPATKLDGTPYPRTWSALRPDGAETAEGLRDSDVLMPREDGVVRVPRRLQLPTDRAEAAASPWAWQLAAAEAACAAAAGAANRATKGTNRLVRQCPTEGRSGPLPCRRPPRVRSRRPPWMLPCKPPDSWTTRAAAKRGCVRARRSQATLNPFLCGMMASARLETASSRFAARLLPAAAMKRSQGTRTMGTAPPTWRGWTRKGAPSPARRRCGSRGKLDALLLANTLAAASRKG
jgi:hypothetical protein